MPTPEPVAGLRHTVASQLQSVTLRHTLRLPVVLELGEPVLEGLGILGASRPIELLWSPLSACEP